MSPSNIKIKILVFKKKNVTLNDHDAEGYFFK